MKSKFYATIFTSFILTSCATLFTGTKDRITFNTTPAGAVIYKDGIEQCITPCSINLKREINDTDIEIKKEGYETRIITLDKEFNAISVLNLGNILAWGIDAASGAVMKFDRKVYDLNLSAKTTSSVTPYKINVDTKKRVVDLYVKR